MYAVAFDLTVKDANALHPTGVSGAYADIARELARFGFDRVQGSVYLTKDEDLSRLTAAMVALKALPWLPGSVRDVRAFRVEHWSDFTPFVKGP